MLLERRHFEVLMLHTSDDDVMVVVVVDQEALDEPSNSRGYVKRAVEMTADKSQTPYRV